MGAVEHLNVTAEDSAEALVADAGSAAPAAAAALITAAAGLATRTCQLMRQVRDPALLASVTLAITDQRMRIAYLEEVGRRLF